MASNPPARCCTIGVKHQGTPTGEIKDIAGTESYLAVAKDEGNHKGVGILFITDAFGHKMSNNQLLADQFAANGYLTLMPDVFQGDPVPLERPDDYNIMNWATGKAPEGKKSPRGHGPDATDPVVKAGIKWLREERGCKRVGAVGYCFGGKYVVRELGTGGIEAGYTAHPSFVTEEELEQIKGPLSIAAAETDQVFSAELRHKSEEILKKAGHPYQMNLYSGVEHGFAVRGDIGKPEKKYAMEQAFLQAVAWFDQWLLKE